MKDIERKPANLFPVLIRDQDGEVTALELWALLQEAPRDFFGNIESFDVIGQLGPSFVDHGLRIHQVEMITRQVSFLEFPLGKCVVVSLRSGAEDPSLLSCSIRNLSAIEVLHGKATVFLELSILEELRALGQPGAIIAVLAVLLLMAAGDAAIIIAAKGWPF